MRGLSCLLNFKENLTKNLPYYELLARQICIPNQDADLTDSCVLEHAIFCSDSDSSVISKVCEGYQFTATFSGRLFPSSLKNELASFGYPFLIGSDAELALLSYIHFGDLCSDKLSGNFSMIVYDSMRRTVFALTKGYDALPIFYANIDDFYIFSTSAIGILSYPYTQKKLDGHTVLTLLSASNRVPFQVFNGIHMLPADSFIKLSQKGTYKMSQVKNQENPEEIFTSSNRTGLIFTESQDDHLFLKNLKDNPLSVYAEKFPYALASFPFKKQHLAIDEGTVLNGLETSVSACGFPFLSNYDYILSIALKRAKGSDENLFFASPDRFCPSKNYTDTLMRNGAFHSIIEKNMMDFVQGDDYFPPYATLISNSMSMNVNTLYSGKADSLPPHASQKLKTTLRRILLDIISKEHAPLLAFFKRSALLRLCEGGFTFCENESESELTAYLIKLNLWFEIFSPKIV